MSKVSGVTEEKVKEEILWVLYETGLQPRYTASIARELGRDKEFVMRLLSVLEQQGVVVMVGKGLRKRLWKLGDAAYKEYGKLLST